ncbi:MAG: YqzL family protein [Ruminococcaceae bacterium]|nr:YqzL family protein [Oscillospiraceae bacterium]
MDEKFFWDVFKNTGSIESYLTYKTVSEMNNNTSLQNKDEEKK